MGSNGFDDDDESKDLTRIEDLSEFLHQEDPELDALLDSDEAPPPFEDNEDDLTSLDDLEESEEPSFESPEEEESSFDLEDSQDSFELSSNNEEENNEEERDDNEISFDEPTLESFENPLQAQEEIVEEETEDNHGDEEEINELSLEESSFDDSPEQEIEEEEFGDYPVETEFSHPVETPYVPEKLEDVKSFAESMSYGKVTIGGNPPYAIILKNVKYVEDAEDILSILREVGLADSSTEENMKIGLNQGALLLSQLSEYAAIYLSHKLRRFDVEIFMGPSDELHPPKSYEREAKGLVSKEHLFQNKKEDFYFGDNPLTLESVIVSTTPTIQTHTIHKYLGVVNYEMTVNSDELKRENKEQDSQREKLRAEYSPRVQGTLYKEDDLIERYESGMSSIYDFIMNEIKVKAFKLGGNGALGLSYNLTPIGKNPDDPFDQKIYYKLMATANVVILSQDI